MSVYLSVSAFWRGALWFQKEIHCSGVCTYVCTYACLCKLRPDAVEIRGSSGKHNCLFSWKWLCAFMCINRYRRLREDRLINPYRIDQFTQSTSATYRNSLCQINMWIKCTTLINNLNWKRWRAHRMISPSLPQYDNKFIRIRKFFFPPKISLLVIKLASFTHLTFDIFGFLHCFANDWFESLHLARKRLIPIVLSRRIIQNGVWRRIKHNLSVSTSRHSLIWWLRSADHFLQPRMEFQAVI